VFPVEFHDQSYKCLVAFAEGLSSLPLEYWKIKKVQLFKLSPKKTVGRLMKKLSIGEQNKPKDGG